MAPPVAIGQPVRLRVEVERHWLVAEAIRAGDAVRASAGMAEYIAAVSDVALLRED